MNGNCLLIWKKQSVSHFKRKTENQERTIFLINNVEVKNTTKYRYLGMNINAAGSSSSTLVKGCEKGRKAIFALTVDLALRNYP